MNTADKRASALGIGLAALLVLPSPGTIDQPDRQHVAFSYRGIEADQLNIIAADPIVITVAAYDRTIGIDAYDRTISVPAYDRTIRILPKV